MTHETAPDATRTSGIGTAGQVYMVFDVESPDLHGIGFAVGWVVIDDRGARLAEGIAVSRTHDPLSAWVIKNVLPALPRATHDTERAVRDEFWGAWARWKAEGAWLAADVPWPVEARFLAACVDDDRGIRASEGPYPLVDVASVRLGAGLDPLAAAERLPDELPAHNPLADARQSARLLAEALRCVR